MIHGNHLAVFNSLNTNYTILFLHLCQNILNSSPDRILLSHCISIPIHNVKKVIVSFLNSLFLFVLNFEAQLHFVWLLCHF